MRDEEVQRVEMWDYIGVDEDVATDNTALAEMPPEHKESDESSDEEL